MNTVNPIQNLSKFARCLVDSTAVHAALDRMAAAMTPVLADKNPMMIAVMNGGLVTAGHLLTRLNFSLQLDSLHATRYAGRLQGDEGLVWHKRLMLPIENRHIVLIDDVLDGGLTLAEIIADCALKKPASVHTAVLVNKEGCRSPGGLIQADFVGLHLGQAYIFGFGMDYQEYHRNLSGIYEWKKNHE